ncbi:hypothetical protein QCA50_007739 [Cerrena zonata]|uniref:Uncharacterized protein n=1 Tax=Cerrena zonata TaxID=2478898 RepID=A0AAW0G5W3_9APHY
MNICANPHQVNKYRPQPPTEPSTSTVDSELEDDPEVSRGDSLHKPTSERSRLSVTMVFVSLQSFFDYLFALPCCCLDNDRKCRDPSLSYSGLSLDAVKQSFATPGDYVGGQMSIVGKQPRQKVGRLADKARVIINLALLPVTKVSKERFHFFDCSVFSAHAGQVTPQFSKRQIGPTNQSTLLTTVRVKFGNLQRQD